MLVLTEIPFVTVFFHEANLILSESNLCPFVPVWSRVEMQNGYFSSLFMAIISFMIALFQNPLLLESFLFFKLCPCMVCI